MWLRQMGPVEIALMFGAETIGANFALTLRLEGDLSPDHLSSALARLRTAYPFSAVRVETGPDGKLWWTSDGVPPYPVEAADPARYIWTEVVAREVQRPFEWRVGPLVRFVVVRQGGTSDLICVFDHGTYDGLGASCFVRDLMRLLADREDPLPSSPVPPDPTSLIPKSVRARARPRLFGVKLGVRALIASRRVRHWITRTAEPPSSLPSRRCRVEAWSLCPETVSGLSERARAEGTTVYASLGAAFMLAFAGISDEVAGLRGGQRRRISCPVDLRRRVVPPVGEGLGMLIGNVRVDVDCRPGEDLWSLARDFRDGLERGIAGGGGYSESLLGEAVLSAASLDDARSLSVATYLLPVGYDLSLSNLGRVDLPTELGALRLREFYGPTMIARPRQVYVGVSTVAGRMGFTMTWPESAYPEGLLQRVRERATGLLDSAVGDSRPAASRA